MNSKVMLSIYKSLLHNLNYEFKLFEFPKNALDEFANDKPDILLTDLNMPEISGLELCKLVRGQYPKEELPIIMITTQTDVANDKALTEAGITRILNKPFTKEQLSETIETILAP